MESKKTFSVRLGKTYYNQTFFNVRINHTDNFGADKATIEIQLGDNPRNTFEGYINRTANNNRTPRIMIGGNGGTYTQWIQKNYNQGDILMVDIITNAKIKLNEKVIKPIK
jgi:hypothetical protein